MKSAWILFSIGLGVASFATGCSSGRDVAVSGETKASGTTSVSGPITLEFYEVPTSSTEAPTDPIKTITLDKLGAFKETVPVEGDKIRVFALVDTNKDGKCTDGELWTQTDATIVDNAVQNLTLDLSAAACPTAATNGTK